MLETLLTFDGNGAIEMISTERSVFVFKYLYKRQKQKVRH